MLQGKALPRLKSVLYTLLAILTSDVFYQKRQEPEMP